MKRTYSVYIDEQLHEQAERKAADSNQNLSSLFERFLAEYIGTKVPQTGLQIVAEDISTPYWTADGVLHVPRIFDFPQRAL